MANQSEKDIELSLGKGSVLPERKDIPDAYKWRLSDIYKSEKDWEEDFKRIKRTLPQIASFMGRLGESAAVTLDCFKLRDELAITLGRLVVYANMKSHEDTANSKNQGLANRASALSVEFSSAISFITPELLALSDAKLAAYVDDPSLKDYSFGLKDLMRRRKHVLSQAEEAIIARTGDMAGIADNAFSMLTNADMRFPPIKDEEGKITEMSEERAVSYLRSHKREVRKAAFDSLYKPYSDTKNTLGATFDGMLKTSKFYASVRKYPSTLESALDDDNIPESVYKNLVDTIESNLSLMHAYMALRKKALRLKELHMYDLYVPLVRDPFRDIPWSTAKEMLYDALSPLGEEYLSHVKDGIENGWIDVFPNKGKRSGAYSWGSYGTHPYIFMNYTNSFNDVSTLVHEMGHSMHSFYSRKNQPYATSEYSIFTAEVASTTNEVLLLDRLIANTNDRREKLYLLNRRLENIRTTVYRQTMFASFEQEVHRRASHDEDTTPDGLKSLWHDLNRKYYGPGAVIDEPLKMEWARIPHFYNPFYVYQYATGYSAATALARDITQNGPASRERYLRFLSSGGSDYPINLLKDAGVDMSTPEPIKAVVEIFERTLYDMRTMLEG